MEFSAAILALLFIAASCSQTFSGPAGSDLPTCCISYTHHRLPGKLILGYYSSSTSCSLQAIVFITRRGRQVCANPRDTWVQHHLKNLKQK
ncbi:C-C motif chemokine 4-like [Heliangelus exortis]|uniref:C-C motif chemokine 4-like n=1 Tax=Heliangelus exortis TaxID=472823 RepID=UPI003A8E5669